MASTIIDSVGTDVACPGRACGALLTRLTRQVEGTPKTFHHWVCPTGAHHVTQQWEPPTQYREI